MDRYLSEREELTRAAAPGIDSARRLASLTDRQLAALADGSAKNHLPRRARWALIALGGYGSGALLPASDLDVLVVSSAPADKLKPFVEEILYPLWDAGLEVGHQVRSKRDQIRAVREDLTILTSTLTGRVIGGDVRLGEDTLAACAVDAKKRAPALIDELAGRDRPGSPYLLEPNLKDGAGGRRDYDELTWSAAILTGRPQRDPSGLVSLGLLSSAEYELLTAAAETTATARWEMQADGAGPIMSVEAAADLRCDAQAVQRALEDTHHLLRRVRRRIAGDDRNDTASLSAADVIALIAQGTAALPDLEEAAWAGRIDALLPELRSAMALRRPGIAHLYTVGAHCLLAATLITEIARDGLGGLAAQRSAEASGDLTPLYVTALTHDLGKERRGPDHAERGVRYAAPAARAFGCEERTDLIEDLVRFHLLLAETASRDDLDDEDAILRAAEVLGRRELVAPLHVLTAADSMATGASVWTDWHEALVGKLVMRLDAALSEEIDGAGLAVRADQVRAAALAASGDIPAIERFLRDAPLRYLAARDADEVLHHAGLVAEAMHDPLAAAHAIDVRMGPIDGSFRVTIVARDRPGLFATLAGTLALVGVDILGVDAHRGAPGVALDTFTVASATRAPLGPERWAKLERTLDAALRERLAVGVRLAERQRDYRQPPSAAPRVEVDTSDPFAAIVTVVAPDRMGLLYDIGRAIADSGLDIRSVTASTQGGVARDTFRVTDLAGEVPRDSGSLGQLQMRLRELG